MENKWERKHTYIFAQRNVLKIPWRMIIQLNFLSAQWLHEHNELHFGDENSDNVLNCVHIFLCKFISVLFLIVLTDKGVV